MSSNGFALTAHLNRTSKALPPSGAYHPVKGCGCPAPAPKQMLPATQGTACSLLLPAVPQREGFVMLMDNAPQRLSP